MLYYKNYSELDLYLHKINRNTKFAVVYKKYITAVSVRWRHCIDDADTKQKPLMKPDCLLGVVPQPTDSRLSETIVVCDLVNYRSKQTGNENHFRVLTLGELL